MRNALVLVAALAACSKEAPPEVGQAAAPGSMPAAPPPIGPAPAAPPSVSAAPAPPAAPPAPPPGVTASAPAAPAIPCLSLVPKAMLDAITGLASQVSAMPEPAPPGKMVVRCEHRTADIERHFGYYVECGRPARKTYAALRKKMRKLARTRRGAWRAAFEAPGTFAFLTRTRRCFGQVAGRLLLRRPDVGERIAAEMVRYLRD